MSITQMMINGAHQTGPRDEYFSNVALLFDGQSTTDQSSYAHSMTTNSIGITTAGGSPYSDGTNAYLVNNEADQFFSGTLSTTAVGTGDFTAEAWVRPSSLKNYMPIITSRNANRSQYVEDNPAKWWFGTDNSGKLYGYSDGFLFQSSNNVLSTNTWAYVALVRESGTFSVYKGTTPGGTASRLLTSSNTDNFTGNNYGIGGPADNGATASTEWWNGYLRDVRLTVGVARYSGTSMPIPSESHPTQ